MKIYSKIILSSIATIFSCGVNAQWWNPMAPKDFEDCVIKNLKSGMGSDAVRALRSACREKFANKETAAEKIETKNKDIRYLKCQMENKIDFNHNFFSLTGEHELRTSEILSKLKSIKFEQNDIYPFVNFQNMNSFGISGLMIGLTKGKTCHRKLEDYAYSTYCDQGNTEKGVFGGAFGGLSCGRLPKEAKTMGHCIIAFSPIYNRFDDSLIAFKEANGFCK